MSGALRQAARSALLRTTRAGHGFQQQRSVGDLPCKPNKNIEDWATRREHLENEFRWDGTSLRRIALFCFAFPAFVYVVGVDEFHTTDRAYGRKERQFMGDN